MSNIPKRYGPPAPVGSKPAQSKMFGRNNDLRFSLRMAEVLRVDYEGMVCDLAFLQGDTPPAEEVPISSAYWSKRAFLGGIPEPGAICIVGYTAVHQDKATRPLILTFLPNGIKTALRFDPFGSAPRDADEMDLPPDMALKELEGTYGPTRRKFRKMYPGMIYAMSEQGSELILDSGIHLMDRAGSEIWLRGLDNAGIITSMDLYTTTASGRSRAGRVIRNALNLPSDFFGGSNGEGEEGDQDPSFPSDHPLFEELVNAGILFEDGTPVSDINSLPSITLSDGRKHSIITENLADPNDIDTRAYTENRKEILEFSDGLMPSPDNMGFDPESIAPESSYNPFIETVLGTVVGNDPYTSGGRSRYGQLLKPVIFDTPYSSKGNARLEVVENSEADNEKNLVGAGLYRMKRPDGLGELFLSHDKEGHVFLSIPASTSKKSNLGAGRSLDADLKGSAKMSIGGDKNDNVSLDLNTGGGLQWSLGSASASKRSLDIRTKGGVSFDIRGPDSDGVGFDLKMTGDLGIAVEGSHGMFTTGDSIDEITGKKEVLADSLALKVGQGDFTTTVASNHDLNIQGEKSMTIGEGSETTILTGGEETDILQGDSTTNFDAPATRELNFSSTGTHRIEAGASLNVEREGLSGSYSFEAAQGSYSVSLGAGSVTLSAGAGSVEISSASVDIQAPSVNLVGNVSLGTSTAPNAVIGGVPGPSPHLDYITGAPLTGNPIVKTM